MSKYEWVILNEKLPKSGKSLLKKIAENRNIKNLEEFINPPHPKDYIDKKSFFGKPFYKALTKSVSLINKAVINGEPIVIHGDYDVDGQAATAILWRSIHNDMGYSNVFPYIPSRFKDGYGLSKKSMENIVKLLNSQGYNAKKAKPLLITVDCGITAVNEVKHAKQNGFSVIITDHHKKDKSLPESDATIWTDKATGAGIAWMLSYKLLEKSKYLSLATLGTIADLQPLTGFNRSIVKYGLLEINDRPPIGIRSLADEAGLRRTIGTYEVGWIIAPRLNATGRLEHAMESLKLLCTNSKNQADELSRTLSEVNKRRQDKTFADVQSAYSEFDDYDPEDLPPVLLTFNENYHEGIIGLVAGKLTQKYNRVAIAISIDRQTGIAKGSARSISGISVIDTLRNFSDLLETVGGHEMAAGFSMKSKNIEKLQKRILELRGKWEKSVFTKRLVIDSILPTHLINPATYKTLELLQPFGVANKEPIFYTDGLKIFNFHVFGKENNHLKLFLKDDNDNNFTAISFGDGNLSSSIETGQRLTVAYTLDKNSWNGSFDINLKLLDMKLS